MFTDDKTPTPEETPETTEKTTVPPPQLNPEEKAETPEAEDASHAESGETEEAKAEDESGETKEAKAEEKAPEKPEPTRALALTDIEPSLSGSTIEEREGEKFIKLEDLPEDFSYSPEERKDLEKLYSETLTEIKEGEIVSGKIIAISEKEIAVDIGFKSEGILAIEEFDDPSELKVGDAIDVYLDSVEDSEGQLMLSKRKADFMRVWERVKTVYAEDGIIRGRCTRRIKGGMVVDLGGVDAFLPGSQIDVRPVRDFDAIIGTEMDFRILKINDLRKNIVVSHKVLKEESLREVREKLLNNLKIGDVLEGTVKNITDFGVFVDLGGVDGLLHITDLSWGRVTHPSEIVQLDQTIKVMVLNYDPERRRISLGFKQLHAHLWEEIDKKYHVGQLVQGRVVSLAKYGAFIEVEPGIEGLVHISEMSWTQHVKHPNQIIREGEFVQVMILNIDKESKKISLGLKQVEEDPWEDFEAKYRAGTHHKGIVRDLVPFGAFVELEDGVEGLVHITDLSWTKKMRHPGEILKKGEDIEVVVLTFDRNERRIALGHKQLEENPWDIFARDYPVGHKLTGTVARLIDKGVLVEVPHKLEGFVPNSQISQKYFDGKKRTIQVGDIVKLAVMEFNKNDQKLILSNSVVEKKDAAAVAYAEKGGSRVAPTVADALDEDNPLLQAYKAAKAEKDAQKKSAKAKKKAKSKEQEKPGADSDKKDSKVAAKETEAEKEVKPKKTKKVATKAKQKVEETVAETEAKPDSEQSAAERKSKAKPAEDSEAVEKKKKPAKEPKTETKAKAKKRDDSDASSDGEKSAEEKEGSGK